MPTVDLSKGVHFVRFTRNQTFPENKLTNLQSFVRNDFKCDIGLNKYSQTWEMFF